MFLMKTRVALRSVMSALPPIADIDWTGCDVRFVPIADIVNGIRVSKKSRVLRPRLRLYRAVLYLAFMPKPGRRLAIFTRSPSTPVGCVWLRTKPALGHEQTFAAHYAMSACANCD